MDRDRLFYNGRRIVVELNLVVFELKRYKESEGAGIISAFIAI